MPTLLIAVATMIAYLIAYHTYGRWLARKIFGLDPNAEVPSYQLCDDVDFVPTNKSIVFGHHFTSIAGTGPIVGLGHPGPGDCGSGRWFSRQRPTLRGLDGGRGRATGTLHGGP